MISLPPGQSGHLGPCAFLVPQYWTRGLGTSLYDLPNFKAASYVLGGYIRAADRYNSCKREVFCERETIGKMLKVSVRTISKHLAKIASRNPLDDKPLTDLGRGRSKSGGLRRTKTMVLVKPADEMRREATGYLADAVRDRLDLDTDRQVFAVLVKLKKCVDDAGRPHVGFKSAKWLAERAGIHRAHIKATLDRLEDQGLIQVRKRDVYFPLVAWLEVEEKWVVRGPQVPPKLAEKCRNRSSQKCHNRSFGNVAIVPAHRSTFGYDGTYVPPQTSLSIEAEELHSFVWRVDEEEEARAVLRYELVTSQESAVELGTEMSREIRLIGVAGFFLELDKELQTFLICYLWARRVVRKNANSIAATEEDIRKRKAIDEYDAFFRYCRRLRSCMRKDSPVGWFRAYLDSSGLPEDVLESFEFCREIRYAVWRDINDRQSEYGCYSSALPAEFEANKPTKEPAKPVVPAQDWDDFSNDWQEEYEAEMAAKYLNSPEEVLS